MLYTKLLIIEGLLIIIMDRFNIYLSDGNILDVKVYSHHEGRNSFIFGPSEEMQNH